MRPLHRHQTSPSTFDPALVQRAIEFLRSPIIAIEPRKRLPVKGAIKADRRPETGRALAVWGDGGWGSLVRKGRRETGRFDDQLVDASATLIAERWKPDPAPTWVAYVPSLRRPELVADLAQRLADALGLPCEEVGDARCGRPSRRRSSRTACSSTPTS